MKLINEINRARVLAGIAPLSESQTSQISESKSVSITTALDPKIGEVSVKSKLTAGVTFVKLSKGTSNGPKGYDEVTVRGTEPDLRKYFAKIWKLDANSTEISELFKK